MNIFRFANMAAFQLLWLLPILIFLAYYLSRTHTRQILNCLGERLAPFLLSSLAQNKRRWKLILEVVTLVLFILALARPQSGMSKQKVKSEGVEIMILFDVSNSMLANDVKPNRLEMAKNEIERLLDLAQGDKVGIIAFAGSAVLVSPVTTDKSALKMFVESLDPTAVTTQGTEFRKAIREGVDAFQRGGVDEDDETVVTRVIVIASDGEDNEPGAIEAAEQAAEEGVKIFALAFGTEKGAPIPMRDRAGNLRGYRKDNQGQVILSKTKGTVLKNLAKVGGGSFYHATFGGQAVKNLYSDIEKLERIEFESSEVTNYDEKYQIVLFFGLLLALIELLLSERAKPGRIWQGRFEVAKQ